MAPKKSPGSSSSGTLKAKFSALASFVIAFLPQLALAGSFAGSAVLMKFATLSGLLPQAISEQILKGWGKFLTTPLLKPLSTVGISAKQFMLVVAIGHLLMAALLILPSGRRPAQVAGVWAMLSMAGAEYCIRTTGFVLPGVPKGMEFYAGIVNTILHLQLFVAGAACLVHLSSMDLLSKIVSKPKNLKASEKGAKSPAKASPAKASPAKATAGSSAEGTARKRTVTPVPRK
eukprot:TRINITY_DN3842_c0_g1_i1.p1 TRINITY_DN3842_c0_g1~~TRINITY_DN3842_c0_g1_i1.p1  ORF type:complete len:261 (+),score=48.04 TRINITY_DN3842_c0_g1_i1:89-784(+)